jgi:hypothetical protein
MRIAIQPIAMAGVIGVLACPSWAQAPTGSPSSVPDAGDDAIRVIAIGAPDAQGPGRWWRPDGAEIRNPQFGLKFRERRPPEELRDPNLPGLKVLEVPERVVVLQLPQTMSFLMTEFRAEQQGRRVIKMEDVRWGDQPRPDWVALPLRMENSNEVASLKVRCGRGQWSTRAKSNGKGTYSTTIGRSDGSTESIVVSQRWRSEQTGALAIVVTHNVEDQELQLIGQDFEGRNFLMQPVHVITPRGFAQIAYQLPNDGPPEVASFVVQSRPLVWEVFEIPLRASENLQPIEIHPE